MSDSCCSRCRFRCSRADWSMNVNCILWTAKSIMIWMLFSNQIVGDVMIQIRAFLKLLLIGLVRLPSLDGQVVSDEPRANFKVISYNVQFLPGIAAVANNRADAPYRAQRLGELLSAWDVVGLNEVLMTLLANRFWVALRRPGAKPIQQSLGPSQTIREDLMAVWQLPLACRSLNIIPLFTLDTAGDKILACELTASRRRACCMLASAGQKQARKMISSMCL